MQTIMQCNLCGFETANRQDKCLCCHFPLTPKSLQRPEVACSEWVEELEAALRHAKSARDGIERRDGGKTFTYGLNGAIGLLSQAIESERSRSSTMRTEPIRDSNRG